MANYYLQFSCGIETLTSEEKDWWLVQMEPICVIDGREYGLGDELPDDGETHWDGPRGLFHLMTEQLIPQQDCCLYPGFDFQFLESGEQQEVWFYAEECGQPHVLALLVQKFLRQFRPDQSWGMTYACSCSKLREDGFSGGAYFVTADRLRHQDSGDFIFRQERAWQNARKRKRSRTRANRSKFH